MCDLPAHIESRETMSGADGHDVNIFIHLSYPLLMCTSCLRSRNELDSSKDELGGSKSTAKIIIIIIIIYLEPNTWLSH